jgi:hypothetical protein
MMVPEARVVDVLTVLVLTLIAVRLGVLVIQLFVPPAPPPSRTRRRTDPCLGPFDLPAPAPTAEGELVRRLAAGTLPPRAYHREMARLAAEDAVRHPVELPPDR